MRNCLLPSAGCVTLGTFLPSLSPPFSTWGEENTPAPGLRGGQVGVSGAGLLPHYRHQQGPQHLSLAALGGRGSQLPHTMSAATATPPPVAKI